MKRMLFFLFCIYVSVVFFACNEITPNNKTNFKYLFLGHTYEHGHTIDPRLFPYLRSGDYDQFWLGGDMCSETTADAKTLDYLDDLFDLSSPNTHWSLGNHDVRNGNVQWITDKTQRPRFYTANTNGLCLLVLDTNLDTIKVNDQYTLIKNICDTIQNVSHLVILSHGTIWHDIVGLDTASRRIANTDFSNLLLRTNPNQKFVEGIYPLLQQVASRGVKVINIAGDFGQYQSAFEAVTADSIYFLGSGITSEILWNEQFPTHGQPDKILIFYHNTVTQELTWSFEVL